MKYYTIIDEFGIIASIGYTTKSLEINMIDITKEMYQLLKIGGDYV